MSKSDKLVRLTDYGLKGQRYHFVQRKDFDIKLSELRAIGITDPEGWVATILIEPLQKANQYLANYGYELFITDGYRPPELYELIQKRYQQTLGTKETKRIVNMSKMPHTTGRTVDVSLKSRSNGRLLKMRSEQDGVNAKFINFYKTKSSKLAAEYQRRQVILRRAMQKAGFKLGEKNEFWHFEFDNES